MATIEERIETIMSEEIGNLDHPSFDLKYEIEAALKRIATEQKAIDIEKACECFCDVCGCKECAKRNVVCTEYKDFRKALEE